MINPTTTTGQLWPLQSGSTNAPVLLQGKVTSFQFQDVPDRAPSGPLAYYLPGVELTFSGTIVQGAEGSIIYSDAFFGALFTNLNWVQSWFGTPVGSSNVLGTQWAVTEYMVNGQRYAGGVPGIIAHAAAGTYFFDVTIFVPFASSRVGDLEHQTSQLALLARASQLQVNVAPASAIDALSTGATIPTLSATCSAVLEPRQELVLGTPIETILTQIVAGAGNSVKITNFGTDTGLQGVDPGGGVLALNFLTGINGQDGSFFASNIADFVWPWRSQAYTQDILGLLSQWKRMLPVAPGGSLATVDAGSASLKGIPYSLDNATAFNPATVPRAQLVNLLFWALVMNGPTPRLGSLQTANSDQTFNMTIAGGFSGSHQILGQYARSFQKPMRDNWKAQVMAGGDGSLAAYVLGKGWDKAVMAQRGSAGKAFTTADESRYLPWQLFPVAQP